MNSKKRRFPRWMYTQEEALNPVFLWIIAVGLILIVILIYFLVSYPAGG